MAVNMVEDMLHQSRSECTQPSGESAHRQRCIARAPRAAALLCSDHHAARLLLCPAGRLSLLAVLRWRMSCLDVL